MKFVFFLILPLHIFYFKTGQILNRFSKDVGLLDTMLPWVFYDAVTVSLPGELKCNKQYLLDQVLSAL